MLLLKKSKDLQYSPLSQPERILLSKEITSFGRSRELVDVVIDSALSPLMISRFHARISQKGDRFLLESDSLNGVLVNSVKRRKCELQDGDEVVFGGAGGKTTEGSVVSNTQSELVYVFQSAQQFVSTEHNSNNNVLIRTDIPTNTEAARDERITSLKGKAIPSCEGDRKRPLKSLHIESACRVLCDDFPGEGTSDGKVKKNKKILNCDEHIKCSSKDDGVIFKRKKKRSRMPFDSDEESSSPIKKHIKKDSPTEIEGTNNKIDAESELTNQNKVFLNDLNEELLCCICRELLVLSHALPCSHTFCYVCIRNWLREAVDCPSCRSKASFNILVPVKVLDNMVEKVAVRVLTEDELDERNIRMEELQARINGRMGDNDELRAEYGGVYNDKEYCEKCNLAISNRLLRWVVSFSKTLSMASYHYKCFKPSSSITISQIKIAKKISKTDMIKIKTVVKK